MCYAIPGRITQLEDKLATIEYFGEKKQAWLELDEVGIGDYVYAQGGFVIKSLPEREAEAILHTWRESFFALQETDLRLARMDLSQTGLRPEVIRILDRAMEDRPLSREDLLTLMNSEEDSEIQYLTRAANFLRAKHMDNSCCVHGIVEFTSHCKRNCHYCGLSVHNRNLERYRMSDEQFLETVAIAVEKYGFQALVLQGGEDAGFPPERLAGLIREIKKRHAVLVFVSVGEVGLPGLDLLYEAGARGLLLRFETSDPVLYSALHPGYQLADRLSHIRHAWETGYLIITGSLIGIPGQSRESIVDDLLLTKELHAEMYSFGPFIPHPDTPMGGMSAGNADLMIRTIALARLVDPQNAKILVTTAFETLAPSARQTGLMAGANSVMLNVTPEQMRGAYSIYPGRAHQDESIQDQILTTIGMLRDLGRAPTDLGVHLGIR